MRSSAHQSLGDSWTRWAEGARQPYGAPMSVHDDIALVVGLACLTEDRTNQEQLALLRVARKADNDANKHVSGNTRMWGPLAGDCRAERQLPESRLEELVDKSRCVSDCKEDKQRYVKLPVQKGRGR